MFALIPSVTRVFGTGHDIYVYLQAYKQPQPPSGQTGSASAQAQPPQPLFAFVTLYREGKKVFETAPQSVIPNATSPLGLMPLNFDLGVDKLARGQCDCQVTVVDPSEEKAAFWRAPIELVL